MEIIIKKQNNMTFDNSVKTCLRKSFTFKGRASRSEFWYFLLFVSLLSLVGILLGFAVGQETKAAIIIWSITALLYICCVPACISVEVRRFHDIGRSGFYYWLGAIPYIGAIIILCYMVQPTKAGKNEYGSEPE